MVDESDKDPFTRLRRELAELTSPQRVELEWRSMMRLMWLAQGATTAPGLVDILQRLLVARLFMDGKLDASVVRAAAARQSTQIHPSSRNSRGTGVGRHAIQFLRYLGGEDAHVGSATQEAAAQRGMGEHVTDEDPVLDDIRQIKSGARAPWGKIRPLSFDKTPQYIVAGEGNQPVYTQGKVHPFWANWYRQVTEGRPLNYPLLRDVALIDSAIWQAGGDALDDAIDGVLQNHALSATANGEEVALNPDTGKLRLVPVTELPENVEVYARRKILKAVEVFEDDRGQSYGALAPDLAMLRRAVEDGGNLPVELYDVCASALARLAVRAKNGECPPIESDALLADYRNRLRDAAADILRSDPEAQLVLQRRQAVLGNNALINARDAIKELVAKAEPLLEGRLADALPEDAETATDTKTAIETRSAASFRLSSRLLRIIKEVGKGFVAANGAMVGVVTYLQAMEFLATSPLVRQVIEAIFRYIWH